MTTGKTRSIHVPFTPAGARTLVVGCCDGRYLKAMRHALQEEGVELHDLVTMPGGPARLCFHTATFLEYQSAIEALDFMIDAHDTERIILIAHADCAYYGKRYGRSERSQQEDDLRQAREHVHSRRPAVRVSLFYLAPATGQRDDGFLVTEVLE
ncbi:MAG: carbonic anhydrase [Acidobacteriota bacterium]